MDFIYQGSRIRRSTGTGEKRLAEAILGKVRSQIVEGVFFDKRPEQDRTFNDMMTRYMAERAVLKAPKSRIRDASALKHLLPVFGQRVLGQIPPKMLAEYKVQRRLEGAAPATTNKELQLVRHAFNLAMREWEWCRENPMHRVALVEQQLREIGAILSGDARNERYFSGHSLLLRNCRALVGAMYRRDVRVIIAGRRGAPASIDDDCER